MYGSVNSHQIFDSSCITAGTRYVHEVCWETKMLVDPAVCRQIIVQAVFDILLNVRPLLEAGPDVESQVALAWRERDALRTKLHDRRRAEESFPRFKRSIRNRREVREAEGGCECLEQKDVNMRARVAVMEMSLRTDRQPAVHKEILAPVRTLLRLIAANTPEPKPLQQHLSSSRTNLLIPPNVSQVRPRPIHPAT